ncbi:hypothetical protein A2721_00335 [Candidatus Gottesmanbacteria bacterium RIFCSPHIGHO2_01_FULL_47_48]|uniref:Uncharacterized protein n=1 Tax=Candidatus Gottesmanbacteria bacterium RIFCSPHIGHO2_01_FULL_47_48 TaxID=1798381 RepID=A0A1F6A100_9BACT|nr:MAG: hypothetical protein A2721_00335 [Candidatus Gottesmanbacteria bacterium RIFCSPHIGHO2_01_FULL_47_48]
MALITLRRTREAGGIASITVVQADVLPGTSLKNAVKGLRALDWQKTREAAQQAKRRDTLGTCMLDETRSCDPSDACGSCPQRLTVRGKTVNKVF